MLSFFAIFLSAAWMASAPGKPAKASTWHSDIGVHGYYCPGGGKRVHLEDCPKNRGDGARKGSGGQSAGQPSAATRQACAGDARKFCSAVIQDLAARRACMKAHHADLSPACKEALAKGR
jgi:hypothetical protein